MFGLCLGIEMVYRIPPQEHDSIEFSYETDQTISEQGNRIMFPIVRNPLILIHVFPVCAPFLN